MTQAPPPYGGYAGPPTPPPPKPRPSGWWFVLGGGLAGAAVITGVALFVWTIASFLQTDAEVPADGQTHVVSVDTDGDRLLWLADGTTQSCQILDDRTQEPVDLREVTGDFSRSDPGGSWQGAARFDAGSGVLAVSCTGGESVLIGPAPAFDQLFTSIALTVLVPLGLGLLGVAILLVTGILWASRPARPKA